MRIVPSTTSSEHWLTLMTCTICSNTPDKSPVYKCNLGHTICYPCFQKLVKNGIPLCGVCESDKFTRQDVSTDFLNKLRVKPGIGRPCRYTNLPISTYSAHSDFSMSETVTVEKLFQLPTSKLQLLFNQRTKDKLRHMHNLSSPSPGNVSFIDLKNEKRDEEISVVNQVADKSSKIWLKKCSKDSKSVLNTDHGATSLQSRKPLKCPHDPCNKIIAVSSFQSHFKYDHCDFSRYSVDRGKQLVLLFNPNVIQHDRSICLGIVKLFDKTSCTNLKGRTQNKVEIDSFWLMVSGSPDDRPNHAYAIFWLFTNNDDFYNTTMELTSQHDLMTVTTFCGVNGIHESQNIAEVAQRLNCLFLTQGAIKSMLAYGSTLKLRLAIH